MPGWHASTRSSPSSFSRPGRRQRPSGRRSSGSFTNRRCGPKNSSGPGSGPWPAIPARSCAAGPTASCSSSIPAIDYGQGAADFVRSGLTFLNRESIDEIVSTRLGRGRLDAFRIRLRAYRETLAWPVDDSGRRQFERIFRLLADLAIREPSYFSSVRAELASWVLHRAEPKLAVAAERELDRMIRSFGRPGPGSSRIAGRRRARARRPVCDDSVTPAEARRIRAVLGLPTFLRDSIRLACGVMDFETAKIAPDGIWVSRIYSAPRRTTYRVSVNTSAGEHYDLKLVLPEGRRDEAEHETRLWSAALSDQPSGPRVLPPLGATDEKTGAVTWRHLGDLTVWEKIREFAGRRAADAPLPAPSVWRKLYIEAMSALFRAWQTSGRRILPGRVSPGQRRRPRARVPRRHLPRLDRRLAALDRALSRSSGR